MQGGFYRPASTIPIKALSPLLVLAHPRARKIFGAEYESLWRIEFEGLEVKPHGAVHIHHRRRGLFARQGFGFSGTRCPFAGPGLQGPPPQARSLSQPRSRNDVAVSARRGVRDR